MWNNRYSTVCFKRVQFGIGERDINIKTSSWRASKKYSGSENKKASKPDKNRKASTSILNLDIVDKGRSQRRRHPRIGGISRTHIGL